MSGEKPARRRARSPRRSPAKPRPKTTRSRTPSFAGRLSAGDVAAGVGSGVARVLGRGAALAIKVLESGVVWMMASRDVQRLAALALLTGALVGVSRLVEQRVQSWPRFAVPSRLAAASSPPAGLSTRATDDLARLPLPRHVTAFDPTIVPALATRLKRLPWVEQVVQVRLLPPNRLAFSLRAQRPIAQLGAGPGVPVVSASGRTMPRVYAANPDALPRFVGVPEQGEPRRVALAAGAQVLDDLGDLATRVAVVDLSNLGGVRSRGASEVVLAVRKGPRVDWGRPGTTERLHRAGPSKRQALGAFLEQFPQLSRVEQVSVRWTKTTYRLKKETETALLTRGE